jgi:hypothetical protein
VEEVSELQGELIRVSKASIEKTEKEREEILAEIDELDVKIARPEGMTPRLTQEDSWTRNTFEMGPKVVI